MPKPKEIEFDPYKARYHITQSTIRKYGIETSCQVCGENGCTTDTHRIIPGKEGGIYEEGNMISLCPNCHRKAHANFLVFKD